MGSISTWHARLFVRALLGAALAFALIVLVSALTDEGGVAFAVRLGRAAPITPVAAAVGVGASLAPPRFRGELRALATLGERPTRTMLPAIVAAAIIGAVVAALLLAGVVDAHGFYPVVPKSIMLTFDGTAFVEPTSGTRVLPTGELAEPAAKVALLAAADLPRFGVPVAGVATVVSTTGLAMVAAAFRFWAGPFRALVLVVLVMTLLSGFQASASSRVSTVFALGPAVALFCAALFGYRREDEIMAVDGERGLVAPHSRRGG